MLISVRIYFQGNDLEPSALTALLGVEPSRSHKIGEARTNSQGKVLVAKVGLWTWQSTDRTEAMNLSDHAQKLWATFKESAGRISTLPNVERAWIDVHVLHEVSATDSNEVCFELDAKAILVLSQFGLPVEFTVGFVEP
jgi:hypothetical protein